MGKDNKAYKHIGLRFDENNIDEAVAVSMLNTMNRYQAQFVTMLIQGFVNRNHISYTVDEDNRVVLDYGKDELKTLATVDLRMSGQPIQAAPARAEQTPSFARTREESTENKKTEDDDIPDINEDMYSQLSSL